jgi:2-hydroxychromene-2-carboxylate isomerase
LPTFQARFGVNLKTHIVGPPDDSAAPERNRLEAYSKIDAERLAKQAGIKFQVKTVPIATDTEEADKRRSDLGHYLGGTLYYGGEWYWGLDRLHYLEARLTELGMRAPGSPPDPIYLPAPVPTGPAEPITPIPEIHFYLSFRSPYSAITFDRLKALADAYGAKINFRFVLPMVMRDLPVPENKRQYIIHDTAREARRLGAPYGRISDPVGRPVERGYALLRWAVEIGRGTEFVQAFYKCVWSEGVDAGSNRGMKKIVERAGLDWNLAKDIVNTDDWRAEANFNRQEMMDYGIWGVPSFRIGDVITWGQDRLWVIENELTKLTEHSK